MNRNFKKVLSAALVAVSVAGGAMMFTGCTTNRPEVELQLAFNGNTYTLEYTLYRKYAPNTVKHFLKLAEEGYYNEDANGDRMCIHDYTASKLYTGGFRYDSGSNTDGGLVYEKYYDIVKTYENFPYSVWRDKAQETPTYTLYGEFSANGVEMGQGSFLKQEFGSLAMFYTAKSDELNGKTTVVVEKVDGSGIDANKYYKYNCATSLFSINLSTSATTNSSYCTFATLKDDSVEVLENLQDAIADYINNTYGEDGETSDFTTSVEVTVDEDDVYVGEDGQETTYAVPNEPIYLNYVKVLKY